MNKNLKFVGCLLHIVNISKLGKQKFYKSASRIKNSTYDTWNTSLNIEIEETIKTGKFIPKLDLNSIGVSSLIGERPYNEDRVIFTEINTSFLLFGIFDGHGGAGAVDFVKENIVEYTNVFLKSNEKDIPQVLRKLFLKLNENYIKEEETFISSDSFEGDPETTVSGTTATVCLLRRGIDLFVGHVGDSRASLCRSNRIIRLTQDHKPDLRVEMDRIIKNNGTLSWSSFGKSRVNGRLEMTRSIGDRDLKPFGVTADPDVVSMKLRHGTDSYILLTTDGTHSKLNQQEVLQTISQTENAEQGAHYLTDLAIFYGSKDNCTAMVIPLGAWGKAHANIQKINFSNSPSVFPRF